MNYRHAYHAGNFADVFKHIVLTRILTYALRKDAPLRYLDTHAGCGLYDLSSEEAQRTGEWHGGIEKFMSASLSAPMRELCTPYLKALKQNENTLTYPGSPLIAQRLLRNADRLTFCEWHERDVVVLQRALRRDRRVKALHIDGYVALNAYVPPIEKRGIVLVDPPFEAKDEFTLISKGLAKAYAKWPQGCYVIWYPIKSMQAVRQFYQQLQALDVAQAMAIEFYVDDVSYGPLAATGLVVINPPFVLADELAIIMPELVASLGRGAGARWALIWLART